MQDQLNEIDFIIKKGIDLAFEQGPRFIGAILILLIGLYVAKFLEKVLGKMMHKSNVDASLVYFIKGLIGALLKTLVIITFLGMVGVQVTSFIALLGALGLAVGMALSGTLQNFAGGVIILVFKPFKIGDLVEAQGHLGTVKEIKIFVTVLLTPDNKTVIVPNGPLSNGDLTNYTTEGKIRVDLVMGISYKANVKNARAALVKVMNEHPKVLQNPKPFVGVLEFGDNSVNLAVRPYSAPQDYWEVYFDIYEAGKEALDAANIEIPFPQMDLHVKEMPRS
ncbi:MAG: small conductance mechanosensitive channel [Flavobacteriales bacterium]|jgi:small conductance mechanosensitive channel|tara:strand:- start:801 stop:1637 length:837 start_codon:yes stop_codon:yes gene_type:complete